MVTFVIFCAESSLVSQPHICLLLSATKRLMLIINLRTFIKEEQGSRLNVSILHHTQIKTEDAIVKIIVFNIAEQIHTLN